MLCPGGLMKRFFRLTALAVLALFLFAGCKQDVGNGSNNNGNTIRSYNDPVEISQNDPIYGSFYGQAGSMVFTNTFSYATASNCTYADKYCEDEDKDEEGYPSYYDSQYSKIDVLNWETHNTETYFFQKDANPTYVVYNTYSDGTGVDKHSGVIIFKAKYSPWGSPTVNCYYGVKFQFLISGDEIPATRTPSTTYTNKVLLEAGYNGADSYNSITNLNTAVEMFAFNNTAYYSADSWTWAASGATKQ